MKFVRAGSCAARVVRLGVAAIILALQAAGQAAAGGVAAGQAAAADRPWLLVSDVHYTGFAWPGTPSRPGFDTNTSLLDSALAEMKQVDPDPPVVIIPGDFLGHGVRHDRAAAVMVDLAGRFNAAFPRAQFVIALGNNDSGCGDYRAAFGEPFLRAAARAWEPLVDRNGAAPSFAADFARDGSYAATLPLPNLRAVVLNDTFLSLRYLDRCHSGGPADPGRAVLSELESRLRSGPPAARNWVVMHIPPGIDAYSTTNIAHRFFVVPFLRSDARAELVGLLNEPRNHVDFAITGHTHHFAQRLTNVHGQPDVPLIIVPSLSPVQGNSPSFLTMNVAADGAISGVVEHSYNRGAWDVVGGLASVGVTTVTATALTGLYERLTTTPALWDTYNALFAGGALPEIGAKYRNVYVCAAVEMTASGFRNCLGAGGFNVITRRGVEFVGLSLAAVLAVLLVVVRTMSGGRPARR